jgi:hypothetical protein
MNMSNAHHGAGAAESRRRHGFMTNESATGYKLYNAIFHLLEAPDMLEGSRG